MLSPYSVKDDNKNKGDVTVKRATSLARKRKPTTPAISAEASCLTALAWYGFLPPQ